MGTILLITGHGSFATGIQSSLKLLLGENKDLYFIDFDEDDTDLTLKQKITEVLDKNTNSQVLFICDILGGTPFKVSVEISNFNDNMEVVTGCNIVSIIEAFFKKESLSISELADFIVETSIEATLRFKKIDTNTNKIPSSIEEDGI